MLVFRNGVLQRAGVDWVSPGPGAIDFAGPYNPTGLRANDWIHVVDLAQHRQADYVASEGQTIIYSNMLVWTPGW